MKYFRIFDCIFIGKQLWSTLAHFATYCTLDHAETSWRSIWSVLCESIPWLSVLRQDRTGWDGTGQDRTGQDRTGRDRTGQDGTGRDGRCLQGFQLQWNNCLVLSFNCLPALYWLTAPPKVINAAWESIMIWALSIVTALCI